MNGSPPAQGQTASHEATYRYIYALPKGELARYGVMLASDRTGDAPRNRPGNAAPRSSGWSASTMRDPDPGGRRVPGHWEGDLVIGAGGHSGVATLAERTTRFVTILALPTGKNAHALADVLIENAEALPVMMHCSLIWDQGSEMARHAALTLATKMPVYFADPHSPWQRGSNENTNGPIREYLPKGTAITSHQPYLTAIAEELNDRPRAVLGYLTPREAFERLLVDAAVAYTP